MGSEFVFVYPKERLDAALARRVFFARRGRTPTASDARVEPYSESLNLLRTTPLASGSGTFYVPCVSHREGLVFAATGTLAPSGEPRSLFLELARGLLGQLLRRRCEWGALGLELPRELTAATRRDLRRFAELATADRSASDYDAECAALFDSLRETALKTNDVFLERAMEARRDGAVDSPTALGFAADASTFAGGRTPFSGPSGGARRRLRSGFDVFNPTIAWADVARREGEFDWSAFDRALDFGEKRGWRTTFGPLTRWTAQTVPSWIVGRSDLELAEAFWRFVEAAVSRAGGRVRRWIVATNVERGDWGPTPETRFAASEEAARRIRRVDPSAEAFWGFERPFGDAETFDRSSAGAPFDLAWRLAGRKAFDGVYLEANFGLSRWATAPRDLFETHRFFDRWASLGLPICVAASFPSANPRRRATTRFAGGTETSWTRWFGWGKRSGEEMGDLLTAPPELEIDESFWSERTQQENARRFFLTAMARRSVVEAIWSRWEDGEGGSVDGGFAANFGAPSETTRDGEEWNGGSGAKAEENGRDGETRRSESAPPPADEFPTSGLFDLAGRPKPALHKLAALKRAYLT